MLCGNGSDRTQHPSELFGEDWQSWGSDFQGPDSAPVSDTARHQLPETDTLKASGTDLPPRSEH